MLVFFYYLPLIILGILLVGRLTGDIKDYDRRSRYQRLGVAAWILVLFMDLIVQEIWLFWACNLSGYARIEQPASDTPLPTVHIGILDGPDCDAVCRKALFDYNIPVVTALRVNNDLPEDHADHRQNMIFSLQPCPGDGLNQCIHTQADVPGWAVPWEFNSHTYIDWRHDDSLFPHRFSLTLYTSEDVVTDRAFSSDVVAHARITWFSWPVYKFWGQGGGSCYQDTQFAYPEFDYLSE